MTTLDPTAPAGAATHAPEPAGTDAAEGVDRAGIVRFGGAAMIVAMGLHIVLNGFVKELPPPDPSLTELQAYLARSAEGWAIVHACRYLAFLGLILYAAGLFTRTCAGVDRPRPVGWGIVGLLGAALWVANGVITNGVEILAFTGSDLVIERADTFWLLFRLTRVLFTAEIVLWAMTILGFTVAGWRSGTLPRWVGGLGGVSVAAGVATGCLVVSVVNGGQASIVADVASLTSLAWFLVTGVVMLLPEKASARRRA